MMCLDIFAVSICVWVCSRAMRMKMKVADAKFEAVRADCACWVGEERKEGRGREWRKGERSVPLSTCTPRHVSECQLE